MLGPCRSITVSTVRGVDKEMNLTICAGGIGKDPVKVAPYIPRSVAPPSLMEEGMG